MHLPCPSLGSAPPPAPQASQTYQVDLGLTLNASTQLIVCVDCTHHFSGLDYLTCVALILFFFSFCLCSSRPIEQRRQWHPTPVLLPGKSHGWRSLVGCSHGVAKSRTRLSDFTFTFHFHALEKEMATHSSVLAWRIPGMGEPGGLSSMGSHSRTRLK